MTTSTTPWKPKSHRRPRRAMTGAAYNEHDAAFIARMRANRATIQKARVMYERAGLEVSDKAKIQRAAGGAYVEAWVWVEDGGE